MTSQELLLRLFLQLTVILAVCRVIGWIGSRFFGQTQVVGEMVAGLLLGPSFFGVLAPEIQQWLFPTKAMIGSATITHPSMSILFALSQIGLVLYMFLVGLDFNVGFIRSSARQALAVSLAGIIVPMTGGALLALAVVQRGDLFGPTLSPFAAALYLGAAMSITAFPVLARILEEKRITRTRLGTLSLAAGSIDDAVAWCLLAVVLATFNNSPAVAVVAIAGAAAYVLVMLTVGKPRFTAFTRSIDRHGELTPVAFTILVLILMLCAWITDMTGVHAVFGAFIAGTVMPRGRFAEEVRSKIQLLTSTFLVPVFFVYSGLNTRLGLVNTRDLLLLLGAVLFVAISGKWLACMLAARFTGESWRDATALGILLNARGLMELIILNIGLERGIITPTLFTIMAMMAIITTVMASPLFSLVFSAAPREISSRGNAHLSP